ncbi:histidine phosphatase family protein [Hymenobacter jejuensis]|uniref:histidine phosphatase family protein n=1 Tax=Hymenobacter jejuensis TaxID=2502781 RepID=UPI0013FD0EB1|nr:histidine phosphatase family protein [Hymenobacter jejuensis]
MRHAEKGTEPANDPPLTPAGEQRALALRAKLKSKPVAAIFTTDTRRTRATVAPLAAALKLTPQVYNPRQLTELATQIKQTYAGKTVVVVGHSNTILETAEALGATRPVPTIGDAEFNYLLEVKVPAQGASTAKATRYGAGQK